MTSTSQLLDSLERVLKSSPSSKYQDEFQVLNVEIDSIQDGQVALISLLEERNKGILEYERAVVQVVKEENHKGKIGLPLRQELRDIELRPDLLEENWLCEVHGEQYEHLYSDQENDYELSEWQRFFLIQELVDCGDCKLHAWVEIAFNKNILENRIKEAIHKDLPQFQQRLENIRIIFWADLHNLYSRIEEDPLSTYTTITRINQPCLLICLEKAENSGSDYFQSISTSACSDLEILASVINHLLNAPSLSALFRSRKSHIKDFEESLGYLPPEYWINSSVLTLAHTGESIPNWFKRLASLFILSILTTISSTTGIDNGFVQFKIKREFELILRISIIGDIIEIHNNAGVNRVNLTQELLQNLLNFYSLVLQGKYTSVNQDLFQRSIVYGAGFSYEAFFLKLSQIIRFYKFEYNHLLGDRFEQQSRTLSNFVSGMMALRQQLASLIDSLTKDLSELTIAVLATTALSIVAKIIDIGSLNNLLIYGISTSIVFVYFYITVFLSRIDNLLSLGERAVGGFINDIGRSQQIWDFPLHLIGIEEKDIDKEEILKPLVTQHNINQIAGEVTGLLAHFLFLLLAISANYRWFPVPILILDTIFLSYSMLRKNPNQDRLIFYFLTYLTTIIFAGISYWLYL